MIDIPADQLKMDCDSLLTCTQIAAKYKVHKTTIYRLLKKYGLTIKANLCKSEEHRTKMSKAVKERWQDPEYQTRASEATRKQWQDPEYRAKASTISKENWQDPEYRAKMSKAMKERWQAPERRTRASEAMKAVWQDPEYQTRASEAMKELWQDPRYQTKISEATRKQWQDPEYRAKASTISKENWQDPEYRAKMGAIHSSEEYRDRLSEATKESWQDLEYRARMEEICSSEEYKSRVSITSKENWQDPEYRAKMSKAMRERWQDPRYQTKISEASRKFWQDPERRARASFLSKENWQDPEFRTRASAISKENWQDPEYRAKIEKIYSSEEYKSRASIASKELWRDPEYRVKASEAMKAVWQDPEYKSRMSLLSRELWQDPEFRTKMALARANLSRSLTKPHAKVCEILKSLEVEYRIEEPVGYYNFDVFIPSHNLLIEVQGDYWHNLPRAVRNDKSKSTYIERYFPDYKLKYVWEHECLEVGKVEAKLKYWLGFTEIGLINYEFNQLNVLTVNDIKTVDTFLYNWHYQHHGRHGLDICGFLENELICVARFTSPTRNESATSLGYKPQEVLELSRLCVHPRYQKKNLLSWFLARCERYIKSNRPGIRCLISFADSTFNHTGAVYKASNWELNRVVPPDYWYANKDGFTVHKKTLWNHANSLKLTESEYANKHEYSKVWGKEKYKFIKKM